MKTKRFAKHETLVTIFLLVAILLLISAVFLFIGFDKITNYTNSETWPSLNHNAYVGGDAYNYIINGNYATGYFVLSMGFMLTATLLSCIGLLIKFFYEEKPVELLQTNDETASETFRENTSAESTIITTE